MPIDIKLSISIYVYIECRKPPRNFKIPTGGVYLLYEQVKKVPRNTSLPVKGFLSLINNRTGTLKGKSKLDERKHFVKYVSISLKIVGFCFAMIGK